MKKLVILHPYLPSGNREKRWLRAFVCFCMFLFFLYHHILPLFDPEKIIESNGGQAPLVIKTFENVIRQMGPPEKPVDAVNKEMFKGCICPVSSDYNSKFGVPHLSELGFQESDVTSGEMWVGGEREAIKRLTELEEKVRLQY